MNLIIELGTKNDLDKMEQFYDAVNDYLASTVNYPGWRKGIYPVRQTAAVEIEQENLYIAKSDGKIIGSIVLNHKPEAAYHTVSWKINADYSEMLVIHTFAVHPDYLKCGIGKKLMDFALESGKSRQMKSIRLDVYEGNTPAIRLYEKCGFQYITTADLGLGEYGLKWFRLYEQLL